ncbi:dihydrolipoyllysine-residue acetyltransferase component 4 of pyruvate dehydrogenase complex, chloroplastic-like isoform X2 [Panicum virgatum]|uniref:dihydrolipoyllysine-residue acetyltransferase component 4 of pyruvate dehydrogenase complex, chloroplastic-like isoform X2 n=1 Tax=Panicum virgatum TaxID=38727 RepID=UPI0019D50F8C|nr:dihydrolipoyllysine-residue acetyltransferase component 4 of pyruvate dehydrogenase complex, chloroplastic-like isoform X2 [Panicum virgatum]
MASLASPSFSIHTVPGRARLAAAAGAPPRRRRLAVVRAKVREIFMPALSSTMTEGKIVSWTAAEGDRVAKGDPVVVVESDKADMDVETFHDGIVAAVLVPAGGTAPVGAPIALLAESEEEVALARARAQSLSQGQSQEQPSPHATAAAATPAPPPPATKGVATPYAKKLAKQHRVDIAGVVGTGPHGRVTAANVQAAAGIKPKPKVTPPPPPAAVRPAPPMASGAVLPPLPGGRVVPFTTMQAAVSRNMVESLSVPTFRVGYSMITDKLDALYEKLDIYLLAQKWRVLLKKARTKQLQPNEYNSGTFTLSNLGMFGVDRFDAILPAGQGAIMAVGASKPTVVADKDSFFSIKSEMLVNVTADHRIIYGADLAAFLQTFAKIVEDPASLTL